jgi:arginine decarboxylase
LTAQLRNRYTDLIHQTFFFPRHGFEVINNQLHFNGIDLMELVKKYGTPLKFSYLPKITSQIQKANELFEKAIRKHHYEGKYFYCYCTKSSHFSFVLN